jgi:dienelactone hydrolase
MTKTEQTIRIPLNDGTLEGNLTLPESARGAVLFATGSGSSRFSTRNRHFAEILHEAEMATLVVDLLTRREQRNELMTGPLRFDIPQLAMRLLKATDWLGEHPATGGLPLGYFGANSSVPAALVAAAGRPAIAAVVSRGGRPDLAGGALADVRAAVLLIVGGRDTWMIDANETAYRQLAKARDKSLHIVPQATQLFEQPGALDKVVKRSADWFAEHLNNDSC